MLKIIIFSIGLILLGGCRYKQPIINQSATIVFKTPIIKLYDKGFITHYDNYIHLQVLNIGKVILNLEIYEDKICEGILQCISAKEFNTKYLHRSYANNFMYNLFKKDKVYFKDKQNNILIKIKKDK
jgi:hypothetical protein